MFALNHIVVKSMDIIRSCDCSKLENQGISLIIDKLAFFGNFATLGPNGYLEIKKNKL